MATVVVASLFVELQSMSTVTPPANFSTSIRSPFGVINGANYPCYLVNGKVAIFPASATDSGYVTKVDQPFIGLKTFSTGLAIGSSDPVVGISMSEDLSEDSDELLATQHAIKSYVDASLYVYTGTDPVNVTSSTISLRNSAAGTISSISTDGGFSGSSDTVVPTQLAVTYYTSTARELVDGATRFAKDALAETLTAYAGGVLSLSITPVSFGIEQSATYLYNQLQIRLPDFSSIMTMTQQPDGLYFLNTVGSTTTPAAAITSSGTRTINALSIRKAAGVNWVDIERRFTGTVETTIIVDSAGSTFPIMDITATSVELKEAMTSTSTIDLTDQLTIGGVAPVLRFMETPVLTPCTMTFDAAALTVAISGVPYLSLNDTYFTSNRPVQLGDPLATNDTYLIFNAAGTYTLFLKKLGGLYNLYETSQLATTINNRLILNAGVTISETTMNGNNTITATPASDLVISKPRYRCANIFSFLRAGGSSPNFTQIGALPYYGWEFINNNYSLYCSFTIPADVADTTTVLPTIQGTFQTTAVGNIHWRLTFNRPTTGVYLSPSGDVVANVIATVGGTAYTAVTTSFTESPLWAAMRGSTALVRLQRINDGLDTYGGSFWLTGFCFRYHCGYLAGYGGP